MVTISGKQAERDNVYNTLLLFYELYKIYVPEKNQDVFCAYYIDFFEYVYNPNTSFDDFLLKNKFIKKENELLFEGSEREFFSLENLIIINRAISRLQEKKLLEYHPNLQSYRITSYGIEYMENKLNIANLPLFSNIEI